MANILAALFSVVTAISGSGGVATWYATAQHEGNLLYCDYAFPGRGLRYDQTTADEFGPWVAVDVNQYLSGEVDCGDELTLLFEDGTVMVARALDAGRLATHFVRDFGADTPILVDVPQYWSNTTQRVVVLGVTGDNR